MRISGKLLWGLILITLGIALAVEHYVDIDIPVFRIIIGSIIIYWGINLVFGGFSRRNKSNYVFVPNANAKVNERDDEYSIVFGNGIIDLRDKPILESKHKIICNSVFADAEVIVPNDVAVDIKANTFFGEITTPARKSTFIGEHSNYINPGASDHHVYIIATAIFGNLRIRKEGEEI